MRDKHFDTVFLSFFMLLLLLLLLLRPPTRQARNKMAAQAQQCERAQLILSKKLVTLADGSDSAAAAKTKRNENE